MMRSKVFAPSAAAFQEIVILMLTFWSLVLSGEHVLSFAFVAGVVVVVVAAAVGGGFVAAASATAASCQRQCLVEIEQVMSSHIIVPVVGEVGGRRRRKQVG